MRTEETTAVREMLVSLYDMTNRSLDARRHRTGITHYQSMIMEHIRGNPGMSQSQLAEMLSTTKQYIGQLVKQLGELGLVENKVLASDSRARGLYLTDLGRERQDAWRADSTLRMEDTFGRLSAEEQERSIEAFCTLRELLPKLDREDVTLF